GVLCLEYHSKANSQDEDIWDMVNLALDRAETEFEGVVIGNEGSFFSAGANGFVAVMAAQNAMWDQLDAGLKKFQDLNMRMRYFPKPVVVAPAGPAVGGGAEVILHASRVVASAETYVGQVEIGIGVIPAGGGTKELLRRVLNPPMRTENAIALPYLQRIFELIGWSRAVIVHPCRKRSTQPGATIWLPCGSAFTCTKRASTSPSTNHLSPTSWPTS
ncbi:MAG: enoyl-CoA hydratase/isomerase family protein, partial [Anaerolineales bacterium]